MKKALISFVILFFIVPQIRPVHAQATGCSMDVSPIAISANGSVNVSATGVRIDDQLQTSSGSNFYLSTGGNIRYWLKDR